MEPPAKILLLDPYDFTRTAFAEYLTAKGFDVCQAACIRDALKAAERWDPDLIVLDIGWPRGGGVAFLKRIAPRRGRPRWPVLIVTAETDLAEFCAEIPVEGFLPKSIYGGELLRKIREILSRRARVADVVARPVRTRILLGDDDAVLAANIRLALERAGYEVEVATSGPAVIERARALDHDLIVLKEVLSGMNGSSVAASLKSTGKTRETPIVLYDQAPLSGQHRLEARKPEGVAAFVPTVEAAVVLQEVERLLKA